jgi:hypothetical protein
LNKVGDQSVSPYLLQRLRSLDEAKDERAQRRRELEPAPKPPAAEPATDSTKAGEKPSGPGIDRKV